MLHYHIKENGDPGICRARKGNCPLGNVEHYSSKEAAREAYNTQQHSSFEGIDWSWTSESKDEQSEFYRNEKVDNLTKTRNNGKDSFESPKTF